MATTIPGLTINEAKYPLKTGLEGTIAVFLYNGDGDPKQLLDYAVSLYVGTSTYHELIDSGLDNPWMRVIISDINSMHQEYFDSTKHKLKVS